MKNWSSINSVFAYLLIKCKNKTLWGSFSSIVSHCETHCRTSAFLQLQECIGRCVSFIFSTEILKNKFQFNRLFRIGTFNCSYECILFCAATVRMVSACSMFRRQLGLLFNGIISRSFCCSSCLLEYRKLDSSDSKF